MNTPLTPAQIIDSAHDSVNSASTLFELDGAMSSGNGCLNTLRHLGLIDNGQWIKESYELCTRTDRRRAEILKA